MSHDHDPAQRAVDDLNAAFYGPDGQSSFANGTPRRMTYQDAEDARLTPEQVIAQVERERILLMAIQVQEFLQDPPPELSEWAKDAGAVFGRFLARDLELMGMPNE